MFWYKPPLFCYGNYTYKVLVERKQKWLYQSKVHSSLVSIHNCKMVYWTRLSYTESLIVCVLFFVFSGSAGYQYSTNTFLYSLKNYNGYGYFKQDITNGYYGTATYSNYNYGPVFGGGYDMYIEDNAGRNTYSGFNCHSYRRPYCDYSIWVGTRYGNNFRPDELEVYYEVLAWNLSATKKKGNKKNNNSNNNKPAKNKQTTAINKLISRRFNNKMRC